MTLSDKILKLEEDIAQLKIHGFVNPDDVTPVGKGLAEDEDFEFNESPGIIEL
jgi:hypothetical protein